MENPKFKNTRSTRNKAHWEHAANWQAGRLTGTRWHQSGRCWQSQWREKNKDRKCTAGRHTRRGLQNKRRKKQHKKRAGKWTRNTKSWQWRRKKTGLPLIQLFLGDMMWMTEILHRQDQSWMKQASPTGSLLYQVTTCFGIWLIYMSSLRWWQLTVGIYK